MNCSALTSSRLLARILWAYCVSILINDDTAFCPLIWSAVVLVNVTNLISMSIKASIAILKIDLGGYYPILVNFR